MGTLGGRLAVRVLAVGLLALVVVVPMQADAGPVCVGEKVQLEEPPDNGFFKAMACVAPLALCAGAEVVYKPAGEGSLEFVNEGVCL